MAKASPIINSFNAGEFSPQMAGRTDLKYYTSACKRLLNFIPSVQGPASNRTGTKFVAKIKDSDNRSWLRRFIFNRAQSYIIEFGGRYARFFSEHGQVVVTPPVGYKSVTYGLGLWVAISDSGPAGMRIMTSSDGTTWTARAHPVPPNNRDTSWNDVSFGNNLFVAVGDSGAIMTSADGIYWTLQDPPSTLQTPNLTGVAYGGGTWVAVDSSGSGYVISSSDGEVWMRRTAASTNAWNKVAYGGGLFVAISTTGVGNRVMTSPDGITWTSRTSAADNTWNDVVYGNALFVAVSSDGASRVMTSPDGITWTSRAAAAANQWESVTYSSGLALYVAVSSSGTSDQVMTSPDGITWTSRTNVGASGSDYKCVHYANNLLVAVAAGASSYQESPVMTSTDGTNWILRSSPYDDGSVPLEAATPFTYASLTRTDGTFRLGFAQTGDVLYITSDGQYPLYKLVRYGADDFSVEKVDLYCGPFNDIDPDNAVTVYASAATGEVDITASGNVFTSERVGSYIFIEQTSVDNVKAWEVGKSITAGEVRTSDGKNYVALNNATTGTGRPIHTEGARFDGHNGVQWEFQDAGFGWCKITSITSATVAKAAVVSRIPDGAVGVANASPRWAFSAFSELEGYPDSVTISKERLTLSKGLRTFASVAADFENFSRYDDGGLVVADMAVISDITSGETNEIVWMRESNQALIIGTAGEEFAMYAPSQTQAFGPGNVRVSKQTQHGSSHGGNVSVGDDIIFVQGAGRKVRGLSLAESVDVRWASSDLMVLADHMGVTGIVSMAYQQEPGSIVWCVRNDGSLAALTYNKEQDVRGWHQHRIGGYFDDAGYPAGEFAVVECVDVIPEDGYDELWMIVKRRINGATKRYVEYMMPPRNICDDAQNAFHVDSGLTLDNTVNVALTPGAGATTDGATGVVFTATGAFSRCTPDPGSDWSAVAFGNGIFVAVSNNGGDVFTVMTSPDGITWTPNDSLPANQWHGITFGNGLFVAVGAGFTDGNRVAYSVNGVDWTLVAGSATDTMHDVTYGNGQFVAVGYQKSWVSPNGKNWAEYTLVDAYTWGAVCYGNNKYVAMAKGGGVEPYSMYSSDGINWTVVAMGGAARRFEDVIYAEGLYVAPCSSSSDGSVAVSADAITWTFYPVSANVDWYGVTYGNGQFVIVGYTTSSGDYGDVVATSPDGVTWTVRADFGTTVAEWWGVAYGDDVFAAVGHQFDGSSPMSSADGITWTERPIGSGYPNIEIRYRYRESAAACTDIVWKTAVAVCTGCVDENSVTATIVEPFPDTDVIPAGEWSITTNRIEGLDHLEGEVVSVYADGEVLPQEVVTGGAIELDVQVAKAQVGLPYRSILTPMPLEAAAADGTAQGKTARISRAVIRFLDTLSAKYGPIVQRHQGLEATDSKLDSLPVITTLLQNMRMPVGATADLFRGDVVVDWPDGYNGEAVITIVQDDPAPCTVVAIMPQVTVQDSR